MAISHQILSVDSGATIVSPSGNHAGRDLTIQNISNVDVFLGGENVNSESFGYKLEPNAAWSVELRAGDHLYANGGAGAVVAVLACGLED